MESLNIRSSTGTEADLASAEKRKADYILQHRLQRHFFSIPYNREIVIGFLELSYLCILEK